MQMRSCSSVHCTLWRTSGGTSFPNKGIPTHILRDLCSLYCRSVRTSFTNSWMDYNFFPKWEANFPCLHHQLHCWWNKLVMTENLWTFTRDLLCSWSWFTTAITKVWAPWHRFVWGAEDILLTEVLHDVISGLAWWTLGHWWTKNPLTMITGRIGTCNKNTWHDCVLSRVWEQHKVTQHVNREAAAHVESHDC